jgi:EmrB/QacA subfamily drug resistance transporter
MLAASHQTQIAMRAQDMPVKDLPPPDSPTSMRPALALGLAGFLANFDVTSVIVALPVIARELGLGTAGYAWVMDAYSLAFTGTLLVAGALADRHGRRRALLGGNILFALASIACGLAWDGLSLIIARALQGVGSAFIVTGGFSLVASTYTDAALRARAFSWLGVITGVAMALGPTLGGLVAAHAGWRWIFLANIPACILIAWWVPSLVAEHREANPRPLDFIGMALFTAALCVLVEALLHGRDAPLRLLLGLSAAAVLMAVFILQQRRRASPIFDSVIFLSRPMIGIAILLAAVSVGYWAVLVFLPPFLAATYGWPADKAGLSMLAATLPMLAIPLLGGKLVERLGWRRYFALALSIVALGDGVFVSSLLMGGAEAAPWLVIVAMALIGAGAALAHPQLSGAVVALTPTNQAGLASAMTVVMRQGAFAIGIAILGASITKPDLAPAYAVPFAVAALAALTGGIAAVVCLPQKSKKL